MNIAPGTALRGLPPHKTPKQFSLLGAESSQPSLDLQPQIPPDISDNQTTALPNMSLPPLTKHRHLRLPLARKFPSPLHPQLSHARHLTTPPPSPKHLLSNLPPLRALPYYLLTTLSLYSLTLFLWTYTYQIMSVTGPSMYPFLNTDYASVGGTKKDWVWCEMWGWSTGKRKVQRGMVVAFW